MAFDRKKYMKEWEIKNKLKRSRINKTYKTKVKRWFEELKSQLKCETCGEDHPATLDFHHVDGSQKEFNISRMAKGGLGKERILAEIAKCMVLCSNCHRKIHWEKT
tara:strand:- start:401 stop:718 length:318 start_codon:yes stop_codon:yes gene_type:complete